MSVDASKIILDAQEEQLCNLLVDASNYVRSQRPDIKSLTLRVAGGWVRDKLMGRPSHDMDIAIDTMMGYEFAEYLRNFLTEKHQDNLLGHHGNIAKIKSNPEKSKHLETANVQLFGIDVDFVNLRNEVYEPGSRIPIITFGTAEQDAFRRDLTINALFYNLHSRLIEDFTKKGLDDLRDGVIRTPLPPYETFRDDPLRTLRTIRFASRYDYKIVPEIIESLKNTEIKSLLGTVISRERVGEELKKMLLGARPVLSVRYLYEFGLFDKVFQLPKTTKKKEQEDMSIAVQAVEKLHEYLELPVSQDFLLDSSYATSKEDRRMMYMAACMLPYRDMVYSEPPKKNASKTEPTVVSVVPYILREELKMSTHENNYITYLFRSVANIQAFVNKSMNQLDDTITPQEQIELGQLVRELGVPPLNEHWPWTFLLAHVCELITSPSGSSLARYINGIQRIQKVGVSECYGITSCLSGHVLCSMLNRKPGPWVRQVMERVILFQLENGLLLKKKFSDEELKHSQSKCQEYVMTHIAPTLEDLEETNSSKRRKP